MYGNQLDTVEIPALAELIKLLKSKNLNFKQL